jgi:hypothetical protein
VLSSYHFSGSDMPASPPEDFALRCWAGQRLLELVALGTLAVDGSEHSFRQSFGRGRGYAGPLKLPDFAALPLDLRAHPLDFGSEVVEVRHVRPLELTGPYWGKT